MEITWPRALSALALAFAVWFVYLVTHSPHLDYGAGADEEFETACRSIVAPGGGYFLGPNGGAIKTKVVAGQDVVDALEDQVAEKGVVDLYFVQRQLDADCADRKTTVLMWSQVAGAGFVLSAGGAVVAAGRSRRTVDR